MQKKNSYILLAIVLLITLISGGLYFCLYLKNINNTIHLKKISHQVLLKKADVPVINVVSSTMPKLEKGQVNFAILLYHHIGTFNPNIKYYKLSVSTSSFERQISYLTEKGYKFMKLKDACDYAKINSTTPAKTVILTFDDGYRDFYTNAYPILKKYNVPATFFIITSDIGKRGNVTWGMMKELNGSGLVEIGSHTVNHLDLDKLTQEKIVAQLQDSKMILEKNLGLTIFSLSYPFGYFNNEVEKIASAIGYEGAVGIFSGAYPGGHDEFNWRRVKISDYDLGANFMKRLYSAFGRKI